MREAVVSWTSCCSAALDWLFPPKCALCGALERGPCEPCRTAMRPADPPIVREVEGPLTFRACAYAYEGPAAEAVRNLKYRRSTSLAAFMAAEVACVIGGLATGDELVVPVPIHVTRRTGRGFNQAELLCEGPHGLPVDARALRRVRATRPQARLALADRLENLRGAFTALPQVRDRRILLVDDVLTSGQTARECALALLAAGAAEVGVVAFAGDLDPGQRGRE